MQIWSDPSPLKNVSRNNILSKSWKAVAALSLAAMTALAANTQAFKVTNIISDGSVPATTMDANFINPWGLSVSPNWWMSAAGSGYNYVVPAAGTISFKVIVPLGSQPTVNGLPAGSVTTAGSTGFVLPNGTAPSFIFSTLDGTISGWNSKLGTANAVSQIVVNNSSTGAAYTGLALLNTAGGSFLLAPNFTTAAVEVYDATYKAAKLTGSFTDPNLPANYAPYSIHILGTQIFVAYAQRTATPPYRAVSAPGAGIVDVFDTTGTFVARVVTFSNLNAPWGVAFAPANYGIYSNDLLIGNFGDGKINVYDPKTYTYIGQLMDSTGKSLSYASLWELLPGGTKVTGSTSVSGGDVSTVYFSAGLDKEAHGLFGGITNTAIAGSTPTFGFTTSASTLTLKAGGTATAAFSIAPANGFSGAVALSCTGLPAGSTCTFAPSSMTVSSTAAAIGSVTVSTTGTSASLLHLRGNGQLGGIVAAFMLPFASLLAFRRSAQGKPIQGMKLLGAVIACAASVALVAGCGNSATPATPTPVGQTSVVVTATAGSISQSTTMAVTVQ